MATYKEISQYPEMGYACDMVLYYTILYGA